MLAFLGKAYGVLLSLQEAAHQLGLRTNGIPYQTTALFGEDALIKSRGYLLATHGHGWQEQ